MRARGQHLACHGLCSFMFTSPVHVQRQKHIDVIHGRV